MKIDSYIRSEVQNFHLTSTSLDPSVNFLPKVMSSAISYEKHRRNRVNAWFAILALTPFALRQLWSLVWHDFISVSSLPMGKLISSLYGILMSPQALYGFIFLGLALALFIVGLPRWRANPQYTSQH